MEPSPCGRNLTPKTLKPIRLPSRRRRRTPVRRYANQRRPHRDGARKKLVAHPKAAGFFHLSFTAGRRDDKLLQPIDLLVKYF